MCTYTHNIARRARGKTSLIREMCTYAYINLYLPNPDNVTYMNTTTAKLCEYYLRVSNTLRYHYISYTTIEYKYISKSFDIIIIMCCIEYRLNVHTTWNNFYIDTWYTIRNSTLYYKSYENKSQMVHFVIYR